ncbi:MAG: internal scaffolding protein [Microvirus sp.]|nr:MAG: internal scaffolding protein [Microvirus sp.]
MFIRNPFNYDTYEASVASGLKCLDESRAIQSQKDEADINTIVRRFGVTGLLPMQTAVPLNYDFADNVFDFRTAMDMINAAERAFLEVPASIRTRFGNDPGEYVAFCSNPDNIEELRKLGLAPPNIAEIAKKVETNGSV